VTTPKSGELGVVFDLDGTLVDSRADIVHAANVALERHGRPRRTPEEIALFVGDGAQALLAGAARLKRGDPEVAPLQATYVEYYTEHPADRTTLMPDVFDVLDALAPFSLAVCTNKPRIVADRVLAELGLARYFDVVVGGGDLPEHKPHPLPILHIAERVGLSPERLIMVGDGPQDMQAGRAARAVTAAVLGGFGSEEELRACRPDVVLERLGRLLPFVSARRALAL
jgi:phosphoglycolate phosphatase